MRYCLSMLHHALDKKPVVNETTFQNASEMQIAQYVERMGAEAMNFLTSFAHDTTLFLHHTKQAILLDIAQKFSDLVKRAQYYRIHGGLDTTLLKNALSFIEKDFEKYCAFGSIYVARHCTKTKRANKEGAINDGISLEHIKEEALRVANALVNEIRISPKKVKLILRHTEMPRTRAFAGIIGHRANQVNHLSENKVYIDGPKIEKAIRFSHFSKEALQELMPLFKEKGEAYTFSMWFKQQNEFAPGKKKHQPDPTKVTNAVIQFVKNQERQVNKNNDWYTIVVAVSHAWVVDAAICTMLPDLYNNNNFIMKEASFFKVECGQFCYLGKWVDFDKT